MPGNTFFNEVDRSQGNTNQNTYHEGDSENQYIWRNGFGQNTGYGVVNFLNPAGGLYNGITGRNAYGKARSKYEDEQRTRLYYQRLNAYTNQQRDLQNQRLADDQYRTDSLKALDSAFSGGNRQAARDQAYDTTLANSMAGLNYQYGQDKQALALTLARKGKLGSSTDAERNAGLANQLNTNTAQAVTDAQNLRQSLVDADTNQYQSLKRALLAGDPATAQQYAAMAAQQGNQAQALYSQYGANQYLGSLAAQNANLNSQFVGGLGNIGAQGVYGYYGVQNPYQTR